MKPKSDAKDEPANYSRRDRLLEIQRKAQAIWAEQKKHEREVDPNKPKYLLTFPYPYMNARLHLGHAFSCSKVEIFARYKQLKGFNVLFPFGFHCTGMPICAAAKKLEGELATEGFDKLKELVAWRREHDPKYESRKMTQFEILHQCYVKTEDIPKFVDPKHWVHFFPPFAQQDLTEMGFAIDFRRSFITTDMNPYYDSFIRWQFTHLREKGFIKFGLRPAIFSEKDNQMCADHDRSVGEGVLPQEYTLVKLELLSFRSAALKALREKFPKERVVLPAATLRPETMYGQTNCFVLPEGDYGVYRVKNDELWVCSSRSMRNASFQGLTKEHGKVDEVCRIRGEELIGEKVRAPISQYKEVFVWPMLSISMEKGTGVVTSVPSDAPDDYAVLVDLKKKKPLREKFRLADEQVLPFEPVEIIEVPDYSRLSAVKAYADFKIGSMNDKEKLAQAKEEVYKKGFYKGRMIIGEFAGQSVEEAKPKIREQMIAAGDAAKYFEPDGPCVSRTGDECVVALLDQWYINYGEEKVAEKLVRLVKSPDFCSFNESVKGLMVEGLQWLNEWGCSRSFGLGSRLPWDENFLIESLSDSTIYMAYYTVAHFLQGDLEGTKPGLLGIAAQDLQRCDWDTVFLRRPRDPASRIPEDKLLKMRESFEYWYPMDLRCSGKDLAKNHMSMSLFNHEFIWGGDSAEPAKDKPQPGELRETKAEQEPAKEERPKDWTQSRWRMLPRGYFLNGWILVDGEKMSKQKGNFILVKEMVDKYGADASRILVANAGDSLDDANAITEEADNAILRIFALEIWLKDVAKHFATFRQDSPEDAAFFDRIFEIETKSLVQRAGQHYEAMCLRESTKELFFNLMSIKDDYKINCGAHGMRADLVRAYIRSLLVALYPLIPHMSEVAWLEYYLPLLAPAEREKEPRLCGDARFPEFALDEGEHAFIRQRDFIKKTTANLLSDYQKLLTKRKNVAVKKIYLVVATGYKDWQVRTLALMAQGGDFKARVKEAFKAEGKMMPKALEFASYKQKAFEATGSKDEFDPKAILNEYEILKKNIKMVTRDLKDREVEIVSADQVLKSDNKQLAQAAESVLPGNPIIVFDS